MAVDAFREARLHGYPARRWPIPHLSKRKLEVLRYVAMRKTDYEIGSILGIAEGTVSTYLVQLRLDFNVFSRTRLAVEGLPLGLHRVSTTEYQTF